MSQHLINRLMFDFYIDHEAGNSTLQSQLRETVNDHLLPALDNMFSKRFPSNEAISIESITLDMGDINWSGLDKNLAIDICEKLQLKLAEKISSGSSDCIINNQTDLDNGWGNELGEAITNPNIEAGKEDIMRLAPHQKAIMQLVHYLQHGTLIWWSRQPDMHMTLMSALQEQPQHLRDALIFLLSQQGGSATKVSRRLVALVSHDHENLAGLLLLFSKDEYQKDNTALSAVLKNMATYTSSQKMDAFSKTLIKLAQLPLQPQKIVAMLNTLFAPDISLQYDSENVQLDKIDIHDQITNNNVSVLKNKNKNKNKDTIHRDANASLITMDIADPAVAINTQPKINQLTSQAEPHQSKNSQKNAGVKADQDNSIHTKISEKALTYQQYHSTLYSKLTDSEQDPFYISNSGLVLLWPFFLNLFELLDLKQANQLKDKQQALLVLHLLITEQRPTSEQDLLLAKILCDQPFNQATVLDIDVSEEHKAIIYELLHSVIGHWSALGNVSIAWFKQVFLNRKGVLKRHQHGWLLQVEVAPPDVLLNKLPWGISTIKLPWMPQPLSVQWAY